MPGPSPLSLNNLATAPDHSGALVDVIVLSADLALFDAIRDAIHERNPVWRARSAEESVDLLLTGRCGVLLVDLTSISTQPDTLIKQIVEQFPEVVVCVAGLREHEPLLAPLISDGLVYRFMHKPLSPRRAGMFLQAAIRHHCERRAEAVLQEPVLHLVTSLPNRFETWKWVFVTLGVALFIMVLAAVLGHREPAPAEPGAAAVAAPTATVSSNLRADPVLSRARAAFDAGRFEAPAGRNALDLFKAVLLAHPDNTEARSGLDKTIDRILDDAGRAAEAGASAEAQRLVDRALEADPGRPATVEFAQRLRKVGAEAVAADIPAPGPAPTPAPAAQIPSPTPAPPAQKPAPAPAPAAQKPAPTPTPPAPTPTAARVTRAVEPVRAPLKVTPPEQHAAAPRPDRATVAAAATPSAATAATPPAVVRPDPLTPRVARSPHSAVTPPRSPTRSFGAPVASDLPIAGYVETAAAEVVDVPAAPAEAARGPSAPDAVTLPADSFEKLVVTDPVYPPQALRNGTTGWVELEFTITPSGSVRDIAVVEAQPRGVFEQAATTALGHWRFRPRVVNGQPVAQRSTVTMHFDVDR